MRGVKRPVPSISSAFREVAIGKPLIFIILESKMARLETINRIRRTMAEKRDAKKKTVWKTQLRNLENLLSSNLDGLLPKRALDCFY